MSKIARKPIQIPKGVEIKIEGSDIQVKGPKGQLDYVIPGFLILKQEEDFLMVVAKTTTTDEGDVGFGDNKALAGTTRANINNLVIGVSEGFVRKLNLVGVGYRAQLQGDKLNLSLGFSHPVVFEIPQGIKVEMPTQTEIVISGIDKQTVGQVAANIRAIRPVEPYKGKGVRYSDEKVSLKETKKK
jgi:large subunit ribosomal protein L6